MKIIIPHLPIPSLHHIAQCIETITSNNNIEILFWNPQIKSIIDMFDEISPDIIFLHESQLDESFNVICQEFDFKYVLIHDSDTLKLNDNLLKQPDAILISPHTKSKLTHPNVISMQPAANIPAIYKDKYIELMKSEILIDTTNAAITNKDIQGLLTYLASAHSTKIIGDQPVPLKNYLGRVTMPERANFIKSTQTFIDIGNVGCYWDAVYLKIPSLSIYPTNEVILSFNSLATLKTHLNTLNTKSLVRQKYISQSYSSLYQNNTSYHISAQVFTMIKEPSIADKLLQYMREVL